MRFTSTPGRALAVALAAATLGLGAAASAQAQTIGGGTTITNGTCSVLATPTPGGGLIVQARGDNSNCNFFIFDSTTGTLLTEEMAPRGTMVYSGLPPKLTGCLTSDLTDTNVCDPLT
ncbi:hypothetical protein [Kitasatospora viridis]|uniref:Secreted protein n=1 Tax=Kitasatospora viridis TaxID=281105 RepID=A0A561TW91_9ACTN|nr:hypothetical protein [Kitasatospora viridis]TWF91371.1 hypothetical protein FHX73_12483 [Kitasatospora viridis]